MDNLWTATIEWNLALAARYRSEAAQFLGCSISTLRRWDNEGKLTANHPVLNLH